MMNPTKYTTRRIPITASFFVLFMLLINAALAAPDNLVQAVTYNSETVTMRLTKENLRGANFELWAQNETGGYDVITPVAERSYLGTVDEYPDAVSYGILQDDGTFKGGVIFDRGPQWYITGNAVTWANGSQGSWISIPAHTVTAGQGGPSAYGFDVGIDARYEYYNERGGGSIAKTLEVIEQSVTATRALYIRDAMLMPYLGRVIVRASSTHDPANGLTGGVYLDAVRNEWNNNHTDADRDVVAGVATSHVWAGLAWVGVIGTSSAYSVNDSGGDGDFSPVWRHELGHNWGLGHYNGGAPEAGTINSNNHFARMSGPEVNIVLGHRDAKLGILDDLGAYSGVNIPPYAALDSATFTHGVDSQVTIDVLANDHDANGHSLSIVSVDTTSLNGGTVSLQGQNLVYTAGGTFYGVDSFTYEVQDSSGQTATGAVAVQVSLDDPLKLYLPLDETAGTSAGDASVYGITGSLSGTDFATASVAGKFGNALDLDGVDDHITVNGLPVNSDTVTITAWVKQGAIQNSMSGILFTRNNGISGFHMGENKELRYTWNGQNWTWDSGLVPPDDTWTFVALVVEPTKAMIYMNSGSGFQSAENVGAHSAGNLSSYATIGYDELDAARHFLGSIDDVRVITESLTQADLQKIYDGGGASTPSPFNQAFDVKYGALQWTAGRASTSNQVYLGTDQNAVANATTASPEYQGATPNASHYVDPLQPSTTYFWRVDTVTSSGVLQGQVWQFTTAASGLEEFSAEDLITHLTMDDADISGSTISDASAAPQTDGTITGATSGHVGQIGQALDFNGGTDKVDLPGASFSGINEQITVSLWMYGAETQPRNDGLFYALDSSGNRVLTVHAPWSDSNVYWDAGNSGASYDRISKTAQASEIKGQWNHWVFTKNMSTNGSMRIYLNGTLWHSATGASHMMNDITTFVLGQESSGLAYDGLIDDFAVWGSELDSDVIKAIYLRGLSGLSLPGGSQSGNNAPVANDDTFAVAENSSAGTTVGTVSATDPDAGDTLSYAITAGNGGGEFAIDSGTGSITTTTALDHEAVSQYVLTITVSDNGTPSLNDTATIAVNVTDVNEAPSLSSSTGSDAEVDQAYNDSIAGTGSDPDAGDSLNYSKVSGPAWLSVASDGSLVGTPGVADEGINQWTVRVTDNGGLTADATLDITVNAAPSGDVTYNATAESTTLGTASGGFAATTASDNGYETLTEAQSGGNPSRKRSQLEHEWTFSVASGASATLRVEAHHTTNSEGDDFIFSYSTDGSTYTDVLTVSKTSDDNTEQTVALPSSLSGTVYIRVVDADRTQGNSSVDSLYVDLLAIDVAPLTGPPAAAANPDPVNGASGTSLTPTLSWDAAGGADSYDVYFGTSAPGDPQGNQTGTSFSPGTLAASTAYFWRVDTVNGNGTTTGTVWSFTTGAGGGSDLFSDDFEDGNVNGWTTTGTVDANSAAANTGVYGAKLRATASMTVSIDTTAMSSVDLEYDRSTSGYDAGEALTVEWSADGSTWNAVESTSAGSWGTSRVTLPAGAAGQAALQIRFSTNANRNNENGYVDNVVVTGS